ncbi:MAG TPA: glycosyltransferase family 4 protein [Polyangiales bacterium]|nr:glycosyltransferase family 4 protein [Polyangiales bacterium]
MRKLLFVSNMYAPHVIGGAELCVQTLAEQLTREGHQVTIATLSRTSEPSVHEVNGIPVHRLPIANVYVPFSGQYGALRRSAWHALDVYNPVMGERIGALVDQLKPDWVATHNVAGFSTAAWHAVKRRGVPLAQVLHDYWAVCPQTRMNKDGHNCETPCTVCTVFSAPKKPASRWPDVAIGVSRFALERHLKHGYFPNARTGVVYNGAPYRPPTERRQPGKPITLGFIGRIERPKGIEVLLEALSRIPGERFRLRVAGKAVDPAYLDELKQRFPMPQVEYLGFVPAAELYESIDLLVVPSLWHETLCVVVYEALGFGVPVLASRVGGIPEILDGQGCGWLFEPGNAQDLEANLRRLLDGWADPQGVWERAIARRAFFTPERQAADFLAVLDGRPTSHDQ